LENRALQDQAWKDMIDKMQQMRQQRVMQQKLARNNHNIMNNPFARRR
jgi:hypothetical protein